MISLQQRRKALEEIANANDGRLTPAKVVETASDSDHPLHKEFDWNDETAGHKYRIDQARTLIRSVQVNIQIDQRIVPTIAYVRDPLMPRRLQGYRALGYVARQSAEAYQILEGYVDRAESSIRSCRKVAAALDLVEEVEQLLLQIVLLKTKAKRAGKRKVAA